MADREEMTPKGTLASSPQREKWNDEQWKNGQIEWRRKFWREKGRLALSQINP
jgi:hypothetical protein